MGSIDAMFFPYLLPEETQLVNDKLGLQRRSKL